MPANWRIFRTCSPLGISSYLKAWRRCIKTQSLYMHPVLQDAFGVRAILPRPEVPRLVAPFGHETPVNAKGSDTSGNLGGVLPKLAEGSDPGGWLARAFGQSLPNRPPTRFRDPLPSARHPPQRRVLHCRASPKSTLGYDP